MAQAHTILIVDDDPQIREVLRILLENEGYRVLEAEDGTQAVHMADERVDLIILDVMMPGQSGYMACAEIRKRSMAPVIFLTAKAQDADKTLGFASGGDDYLAKPFSASELLARVKAALRRYLSYGTKAEAASQATIALGDLLIDSEQNQVLRQGQELQLTETEYRILLLLAQNRRKIFSVQNIYESVWQEPYFYSANNTVMVHVRNLRKKIGDKSDANEIIKTVWGRGYRID